MFSIHLKLFKCNYFNNTYSEHETITFYWFYYFVICIISQQSNKALSYLFCSMFVANISN